MRSHESYSLNSFYLAYHLKKVGKRDLARIIIFKIKAVGINILAKEHNFLYAVSCKLLALSDDIFRSS